MFKNGKLGPLLVVVGGGGGCRDLSIQITQVEPYRHNLNKRLYFITWYTNKAKKTKQKITKN
jgi:hypothetical protein